MDEGKEFGWFERSAGEPSYEYPVKREYRRLIFRKIMGVYTCLDDRQLTEVEILNITPKGCAFRMSEELADFAVGDELALRFYFTLNTYLPARLDIRNRREQAEEHHRYLIYGCAFDQNLEAYPCLANFIRNMYFYADHCIQDNRGGVFGL